MSEVSILKNMVLALEETLILLLQFHYHNLGKDTKTVTILKFLKLDLAFTGAAVQGSS